MFDRFIVGLGAVCLLLFAMLHFWQNPGLAAQPLRDGEIDVYLERIEHQLSVTPAEKRELVRRLRSWAQTDDGRPAHMLNVMRYRQHLLPPGDVAPPAETPEAVNTRYEAAVRPLILKQGGYPLLSGLVLGDNVVETPAVLDHWDKVTVVRYPNRRAFLEMISDPGYAGLEALKLMAVEVMLVPFDAQLRIPDLRWPGGLILLAVFLATGWWRAARLNHRGPNGAVQLGRGA